MCSNDWLWFSLCPLARDREGLDLGRSDMFEVEVDLTCSSEIRLRRRVYDR
jgi:hypothetical protein